MEEKMKVKDLISKLEALDPSGEKEVDIKGMDVYIDKKPACWRRRRDHNRLRRLLKKVHFLKRQDRVYTCSDATTLARAHYNLANIKYKMRWGCYYGELEDLV